MRWADGKYVGSIIDTHQTKRELNPYVNIENPDKTAHDQGFRCPRGENMNTIESNWKMRNSLIRLRGHYFFLRHYPFYS